MIKITISKFINTLINIITGSPSSIIFIIFGIIFMTAMIINIKKHKMLGRKLFMFGWIFIILFIIIKYSSYLSTLLDNSINYIFRQVFFPNLATYVIIIILSNIIYLHVIIDKKRKSFSKVINTLFFSVIMFLMIYLLDQIISGKINIYSEKIYTNQNILVLIETTTITFGIWCLLLLSRLSIKKLIDLSNEKVKKEEKNIQEGQDIIQKENIKEINDINNQITQENIKEINDINQIIQEENNENLNLINQSFESSLSNNSVPQIFTTGILDININSPITNEPNMQTQKESQNNNIPNNISNELPPKHVINSTVYYPKKKHVIKSTIYYPKKEEEIETLEL